jgi:hypothetical protein
VVDCTKQRRTHEPKTREEFYEYRARKYRAREGEGREGREGKPQVPPRGYKYLYKAGSGSISCRRVIVIIVNDVLFVA